MAAVIPPPPALYASVLQMLQSADPRESSVAGTLRSLVPHITAAEAQSFPQALAGVLPLLAGDARRLRYAAELATRLDLWEIADEVAGLAASLGDPELTLSAAALCGTAGSGARWSDLLLATLPATGLRPAVAIRLSPEARADTTAEEGLFLQRWPGFRSRRARGRLAPVVVLDSALPAAESLRLSVELLAAGASVRRLPEGLVPDWFGPETVFICEPRARRRVLAANPQYPENLLIVSPSLGSDADVASVLRRVNSALGGGRTLRLDGLPTPLSTSVWDPDVYRLGVYETHEASYLTAASTSAIYSLARKGLLSPRVGAVITWAFPDVVAIRTWQFLKTMSHKRISSDIIPRLARFAGDAEASRIGATSSGRVLAYREDAWEDVVSGERVLDLPIEAVDEGFRPFSIGGRTAPDLLNASPNTWLNPAILHGAPHLKGHRISAVALASLARRNGYAAIAAAYPELEGVDVSDTVRVGHALAVANK
jgi:uncharacterized protein (DUF433 family)